MITVLYNLHWSLHKAYTQFCSGISCWQQSFLTSQGQYNYSSLNQVTSYRDCQIVDCTENIKCSEPKTWIGNQLYKSFKYFGSLTSVSRITVHTHTHTHTNTYINKLIKNISISLRDRRIFYHILDSGISRKIWLDFCQYWITKEELNMSDWFV